MQLFFNQLAGKTLRKKGLFYQLNTFLLLMMRQCAQNFLAIVKSINRQTGLTLESSRIFYITT